MIDMILARALHSLAALPRSILKVTIDMILATASHSLEALPWSMLDDIAETQNSVIMIGIWRCISRPKTR